MPLAKQITSIHLENSNFVNGDENTGQRYTIDTNNIDVSIQPEFYTGSSFDKALSGKLRQNLRGYRVRVELSYSANVQASRMRDLFNDIITAFVTNNVDSVTFYPDAGQADNFEVVLDDSQYNSVYEGTVASFIPSLSLIALDEITSIPTYLEAP